MLSDKLSFQSRSLYSYWRWRHAETPYYSVRVIMPLTVHKQQIIQGKKPYNYQQSLESTWNTPNCLIIEEVKNSKIPETPNHLYHKIFWYRHPIHPFTSSLTDCLLYAQHSARLQCTMVINMRKKTLPLWTLDSSEGNKQ